VQLVFTIAAIVKYLTKYDVWLSGGLIRQFNGQLMMTMINNNDDNKITAILHISLKLLTIFNLRMKMECFSIQFLEIV